MKKVIDGKLYNTETATEITSYSNNLGANDFNNLSETLYKTDNGNWFLKGTGGAMTKYSVSIGNGGRSGSSTIIALTEQEAFQWCETNDEIKVIEQHFTGYIDEA